MQHTVTIATVAAERPGAFALNARIAVAVSARAVARAALDVPGAVAVPTLNLAPVVALVAALPVLWRLRGVFGDHGASCCAR